MHELLPSALLDVALFLVPVVVSHGREGQYLVFHSCLPVTVMGVFSVLGVDAPLSRFVTPSSSSSRSSPTPAWLPAGCGRSRLDLGRGDPLASHQDLVSRYAAPLRWLLALGLVCARWMGHLPGLGAALAPCLGKPPPRLDFKPIYWFADHFNGVLTQSLTGLLRGGCHRSACVAGGGGGLVDLGLDEGFDFVQRTGSRKGSTSCWWIAPVGQRALTARAQCSLGDHWFGFWHLDLAPCFSWPQALAAGANISRDCAVAMTARAAAGRAQAGAWGLQHGDNHANCLGGLWSGGALLTACVSVPLQGVAASEGTASANLCPHSSHALIGLELRSADHSSSKRVLGLGAGPGWCQHHADVRESWCRIFAGGRPA